MAETNEARPTPPGLYSRGEEAGVTSVEITAMALSVLWLIAASWYFLAGGDTAGTDGTGGGFALVMLVIVLPVAMIWVAAMAVRASRVMREESKRLQAAIDALRQAYVAQSQAGKGQPPHPQIVKRLDDLSGGMRNLESTLAMLGGIRQAEPQAMQGQTAPDDQPALSLGTPAEALLPPLSNDDLVRALHFPETAEDDIGFAALRRALKDRQAAKVIQAAQDILTLMSQDGIYMDDLRPDMARPEVWRAFAKGERGRTIAPLGGVHDRSSLALAAGRMREDPIFRDAAHHFLRRYDQLFANVEPNLSDEDIQAFASTRTSRAFMLLGRVAGTFD